MDAKIGYGETRTAYKGNKNTPVAMVYVNGTRFNLGVGDTSRCAKSLESAGRTLTNLAEQAGVKGYKPDGEAARLHAHCRQVLKMPAVE